MYIVEGVKDGLVVNITMAKYQNSELIGAVHILGNTITPIPWAQSGLALAAGLRYLEHIQLITGKGIGPASRESTPILYADYPPLHLEKQVKR